MVIGDEFVDEDELSPTYANKIDSLFFILEVE